MANSGRCLCQIKSNAGGGAASDDPDSPREITIDDVKAAHERIKDKIVRTMCVKSHVSDLFDMEIYLKMEQFQYTGSFKERGACNALLMLPPEKQKLGVIASSAGNHGQAVAYHGGLLNINSTIVMPVTAPIMKVEKCKKYKANIVLIGENIGDAKKEALKLAKEKGLTFINGFDNVHILAGQGTMAMEIVEQTPKLDAIVIPVGGGSLIAGSCIAINALSPSTKIIGVIPERCTSLEASLKANKSTEVKVKQTLADGLLVPKIGENSLSILKNTIHKVIKVKEEHIALAMLRLIELEKIVTEGAGAITMAAIFSGQLQDELKGKKVCLIMSGGNVDTIILKRCLDRGMAAEGRLVKIKCQLIDKPGNVTDLCHLINSIGVGIKDIFHERTWVYLDVFSVIVKLICETRDHKQAVELKTLLKSKYEENVHFLEFPENYEPPPLF